MEGTQVGQQVGQNNHNCNHFNQTGSSQAGHCFSDPLGVLPHYNALFYTVLLDQEDELDELVMYYAQRGFPFSDEKLCQLAYELASKTNRKGFSPTKKMAGRKWLRGLLQRKDNLHRKNSQNISAARAIGANPVQIENFFELLVQWVHKWKIEFLPNNIWNIDEISVQDVPKSQKVILIKGE